MYLCILDSQLSKNIFEDTIIIKFKLEMYSLAAVSPQTTENFEFQLKTVHTKKKVKMSTEPELRRLKWALTDKVDIFNFFSQYEQSLAANIERVGNLNILCIATEISG